jgi:hypothetical protein
MSNEKLNKKCTKCEEIKPKEEFYKDRSYRCSVCIACQKIILNKKMICEVCAKQHSYHNKSRHLKSNYHRKHAIID